MHKARRFLFVCVGLLWLTEIGGCSTRPRFPTYTLVQVWGTQGDGDGQFNYPWAVAVYQTREEPLIPRALQGPVFWEVLVFLATLAVAYVYAWRKGVFRWR